MRTEVRLEVFSNSAKVNLFVTAAAAAAARPSTPLGQLQSRLVLRVTGSGSGGGLALFVEFQEGRFLYHHGNVPAAAFVTRQGPFLRRFG